MRLGVKHGKGWDGEIDGCGEHTSNPIVGAPDLDHFYRGGGLEWGVGRRSDVDHYGVARGPFIAHPLSGPGKTPYLPEE